MRRARKTRAARSADRHDPTRSIVYALAANVVVALAKFAGALFTGSGALLAEALHSLADSGNEGLLLWGRRQARKPASTDHPLGHGRATYFWSFIVAMLLFSMGGIASIYEGIHKLQAHAGLQSPWVAVAILVFSAVAEGISQVIALKQIRVLRGDRSLWRWFRETRRSELLVVFSENAAALVGLAIALAAVLAAMATGNDAYDATGSVAVGVLLVVVALILGAEIKSLLIGESAAPAVRRAILEFLKARQEIVEVATVITQQQGEAIMLGVKARMHRTATPGDLVAAIARCEAALQAAFPQVKWVFFEPVPDSKDSSD
jgi:cation diffusion facilitator family transporter